MRTTGDDKFVDATGDMNAEQLLPDFVERLQQGGYTILGRIKHVERPSGRDSQYSRADRKRLLTWRSRPPMTLLAARDGAAYATVDLYGEAPVTRMRTELRDGSLVETIGVSPRGVPKPRRSFDPLIPFKVIASRSRSVLLTEDPEPSSLLLLHRDHVSRTAAARDSTPREHADRSHAIRLWNHADTHAEKSSRAWTRTQLAVTPLAFVPAVVVSMFVVVYVSYRIEVQTVFVPIAIGLGIGNVGGLLSIRRARAFQRRALQQHWWRAAYEETPSELSRD